MGLLFTLVEGKWINWMGSASFDLDLLTIITAYLFLCYGKTAAGIFAFGQGFLVDLFSGGLRGLFTFLCLCVFGAVFLSCRFFDLQTPKGYVIVVCLATSLKKVILLMILLFSSPEVAIPVSFLWMSGVSVISTALVAAVLYYLFNRLRSISLEDMRSVMTE